MNVLQLSPAKRRYGARNDSYDPRDFKLPSLKQTLGVPDAVALPAYTENRKFVGAIKDQGQEGSCTGHRTAEQWEWEYRRFLKQDLKFSPQFAYNMERTLEGTPLTQDNGAEPRDGCKVVTQYGLALEEDFPYVPQNFALMPGSDTLAKAAKFKGGAYHRLLSVQDLKQCMASLENFPGHVASFAFTVLDTFETYDVAHSGLVPMPAGNEQVLGGHDTLAVDFDDRVQCPGAPNPGAFLIQNSWGTDWGCDPGTGTRGWFWFPYDAVPVLVSDMWVLHLGGPWK